MKEEEIAYGTQFSIYWIQLIHSPVTLALRTQLECQLPFLWRAQIVLLLPVTLTPPSHTLLGLGAHKTFISIFIIGKGLLRVT
jgi:hypothetical protein